MTTARYENLQVYKRALDLAVYFEKIVRNFSQYNKYTLGADLRNLSRRILVLIAKANTKEVRKESLESALDTLEELKIIVHLCKEVKVFHSFNSFEVSVKAIVEVSKQCEGWLRSLNSSRGTP